MEIYITSVLVIVIACLGCFILIRSKDWSVSTKKSWSKKEKDLKNLNTQLDSLEEQLQIVTPILEKTNEVFKKIES